jgi:hypothetical protein
MKEYYFESRSRGKSYMKYVNGRQTLLVTFCVETAFYNGLMKERYKGGIKVTGRQGRRRRKLLDDVNPQVTNVIYIYGAPILDVSRSHTTTQHSR